MNHRRSFRLRAVAGRAFSLLFASSDFASTPGHTNAAMEDPVFLDLVTRYGPLGR